jgi:N-acylneuraminate cytidylyltransferase
MPSIVALIPARGGSKRIPGKNIKPLGGKPLIQWTIEAAKESGIFNAIVVSSDDEEALEIGWQQGVLAYHRNPDFARDDSPDILWVKDTLFKLGVQDIRPDAFAILRPTSPFRTADTIRRAHMAFQQYACSSIRAVEPAKQHPGKMWQVRYNSMSPLIGHVWPAAADEVGLHHGRAPWHSQPTQSLPQVFIQNASLELAWTWCVTVFDSISGPKVAPFFTEGWEGFDINTPEDWDRAERHVADLHAAAAAQ